MGPVELAVIDVISGGNDGRDHHPNAFTMWLAGGGVKPGVTLGESDDFGFNVTKDRVHVHDLHATILHLLGFDPLRFSYKFQGLDQRLIGVEPAGSFRSFWLSPKDGAGYPAAGHELITRSIRSYFSRCQACSCLDACRYARRRPRAASFMTCSTYSGVDAPSLL